MPCAVCEAAPRLAAPTRGRGKGSTPWSELARLPSGPAAAADALAPCQRRQRPIGVLVLLGPACPGHGGDVLLLPILRLALEGDHTWVPRGEEGGTRASHCGGRPLRRSGSGAPRVRAGGSRGERGLLPSSGRGGAERVGSRHAAPRLAIGERWRSGSARGAWAAGMPCHGRAIRRAERAGRWGGAPWRCAARAACGYGAVAPDETNAGWGTGAEPVGAGRESKTSYRVADVSEREQQVAMLALPVLSDPF